MRYETNLFRQLQVTNKTLSSSEMQGWFSFNFISANEINKMEGFEMISLTWDTAHQSVGSLSRQPPEVKGYKTSPSLMRAEPKGKSTCEHGLPLNGPNNSVRE